VRLLYGVATSEEEWLLEHSYSILVYDMEVWIGLQHSAWRFHFGRLGVLGVAIIFEIVELFCSE